MKFKCAWCKTLLPDLTTPGDEINDSLICPDCAKDVKDTLVRVKKMKRSLFDFIANPN